MRLFYEPFTSLEVFLPESLLDQIDLQTRTPLVCAHIHRLKNVAPKNCGLKSAIAIIMTFMLAGEGIKLDNRHRGIHLKLSKSDGPPPDDLVN